MAASSSIETIADHLSPASTTSAGASVQMTDDMLSVDENEILSGALLSFKHQFTGTGGQKIGVNPLIVDFSRLLTGTSKFAKGGVQILPGIENRDLLHAVVGLYDVALGDMTADIIYSTVTDKLARTIILVKDVKDTLDDLNKKKYSKDAKSESTQDCGTEQQVENGTEQKSENLEEDKDVLEAEVATPSKFEEVYSDTDDEEEDSEDEEEEEEDFSKGINTFIKEVQERRNQIKKCDGEIKPEHIGIEHRIVAAATFTKTYIVPSDRVVHLKFIAVRKRFRGLGVGRYLLSQMKDSDLLGSYDAIVVHADNSAVQFFQKYGFSDDIMLNTRWSDLAEEFTNCTLMCYLPPFSERYHGHTPELDLITMEKEIKKWREKSLDAYRAEMSCMNRMRIEIIHLKAMVTTQKDLINKLTTENKELRQDKFVLEREFMTYRLYSLKTIFTHDSDDEQDGLDTQKLIQELEDSVKNRERSSSEDSHRLDNNENTNRFMISGSRGSMDKPYCHGKDTADFYTVTKEFEDAMKMDKKLFMQYEVKMVTKAIIPQEVQESYNKRVECLHDKETVLSLYFCGSLEQSDRLQEIICEGFKSEDFIEGDFGKGLYFSKYPSKASQFSALGKLLLTEVAVGKVCTVVGKDSERVLPEAGFDSILAAGRLLIGCEGDDKAMVEEYVVFDTNQAIPLHLIEYAPQTK